MPKQRPLIWRALISLVIVIAIIGAAVFVYIDRRHWEEWMPTRPSQHNIDSRTTDLMEHLNNPTELSEDGNPEVFPKSGLFDVAEDSPTADEARYVYAAALPMDGCKYVDWSGKDAYRTISAEKAGDYIYGVWNGESPNSESWAREITLINVEAQISCNGKTDMPSAKIQYGLRKTMGTMWYPYTRIYSVEIGK